MKTLKELVDQSHSIARSKGFWDKERNVGELMMLVTTELAEGFEAYRQGSVLEERGVTTTDLQEYMDIETSDHDFKQWFDQHVKGTLEEELADTLIRLFDLCGGMEIPIEEVILLKMRYNQGRERLHGKRF